MLFHFFPNIFPKTGDFPSLHRGKIPSQLPSVSAASLMAAAAAILIPANCCTAFLGADYPKWIKRFARQASNKWDKYKYITYIRVYILYIYIYMLVNSHYSDKMLEITVLYGGYWKISRNTDLRYVNMRGRKVSELEQRQQLLHEKGMTHLKWFDPRMGYMLSLSLTGFNLKPSCNCLYFFTVMGTSSTVQYKWMSSCRDCVRKVG